MDKFKEETMLDYTCWDINCPYICRMRKTRNKLKILFKRKARRRLKRSLCKQMQKIEY